MKPKNRKSEHDIEMKVPVIGLEGENGKSTFLFRASKGVYGEKSDRTIEDSYLVDVEHEGKQYPLELLDIWGVDQFTSMRDLYIKSASAVVLCYSILAESTFLELVELRKQLIQLKGKEPFVLALVGVKLDLQEQRAVSTLKVQVKANEWGAIFYEVSAKNGTNIKEFCSELVSSILDLGKLSHNLVSLVRNGMSVDTKLSMCCQTPNPDPAAIRYLVSRGADASKLSVQDAKKTEVIVRAIKNGKKDKSNLYIHTVAALTNEKLTELDVAGNWLTVEQMSHLVKLLKQLPEVKLCWFGEQLSRMTQVDRAYVFVRDLKIGLNEKIKAFIERDAWQDLLKDTQVRNAMEKARVTVLHLATWFNKGDKIELLLKEGILVSSKDIEGKTAIDWANEAKYPHLAKLLQLEKQDAEFKHLTKEQSQSRTQKAHLKEQKKQLDNQIASLTKPDHFAALKQDFFWAKQGTSEVQVCAMLERLYQQLLRAEQLVRPQKKGLSGKWLGGREALGAKHPMFEAIRKLIFDIKQNQKQLSQYKQDKSASELDGLASIDEFLSKFRTYYEGYIQAVIESNALEREAIFQVPAILYGAGVKPAQLKDEVAQVLLSNINGMKANDRGAHKVVRYQGIHFKLDPHAPGVEFMVDSLSQLLAGRGAAPTELLKIFGSNGHGYTYLASKTVTGEDLEQVLRKRPELVAKVKPFNFSAMMMIGLLTDPQDGKPDNYMVELDVAPCGEIEGIEIIGIDNDISFADAVVLEHTERRGTHFVNVKNVLYFFPQMKQPLAPEFRERLLDEGRLNQVLIDWIVSIHEKNLEYLRLLAEGIFTKEEFESTVNQNGNAVGYQLPIKIKPGTIHKIYRKLMKVHELLIQQSNITHEELLHRVEPVLSRFYSAVNECVSKREGTLSDAERIEACITQLYRDTATKIEDAVDLESQIKTQGLSIGTQLVLKTAKQFGFEENKEQTMQAAMEELVCSMDWGAMNDRVRGLLYEAIDKTKLLKVSYKEPLILLVLCLERHIYNPRLISYLLKKEALSVHQSKCTFGVYQGESLFHAAVCYQQHRVVDFFIKLWKQQGHSVVELVNMSNKRGKTPLHLAVSSGDVKMLGVLLSHGADASICEQAHGAPSGACKTMIEKGIEKGWSPERLLFQMIRKRCYSAELVKLLGGYINSDTYAENGDNLLHLCARYHQLTFARYLLEHGLVKADALQRPPQPPQMTMSTDKKERSRARAEFHVAMAAYHRKVELIVKFELINHAGTALHVAAEMGDNQMIELLLKAGSTLWVRDKNGSTVLHIAARCGRVKLLQQLLKQEGADINLGNLAGNTPLHLAAQRGYIPVMELLIAEGANVFVKNSNGFTPAQVAEQEDVKQWLLNYELRGQQLLAKDDSFKEYSQQSEPWLQLYERDETQTGTSVDDETDEGACAPVASQSPLVVGAHYITGVAEESEKVKEQENRKLDFVDKRLRCDK